jgi:chaperone BCS1
MRAVISVLKPIVIGFIMRYINISDSNLQMQIALLISALFDENWITYLKPYLNFMFPKDIRIPHIINTDEINVLFLNFQKYMTSKFTKQLESCELIPKNGDVEFNIIEAHNHKFIDTHKDSNGHMHDLVIKVIKQDTTSLTSNKYISISSTSASSDEIRKYVKRVTMTSLKVCNEIKIYSPNIRTKKEEKIAEWNFVTVKTTKTLDNTIYAKEVEIDLFEDIDRFINSEDWYNAKGIPYKRGFLLHSSPGQGKSSVAKILANKYNLPIFCLDLSLVNDNATITKLINDINYWIHGEKYILLLEDAERSDFFSSRYRDNKVSMDCFLNVLDGIVEPHGRILIMTANDAEPIMEHEAIIRPGRIDKIIKLSNCNLDQLKRMYELFYGDDTNFEQGITKDDTKKTVDTTDLVYTSHSTNSVDWSKWNINLNISAATVMKLLQENIGNPERFLSLIGYIKSGNSNEIPDIENSDIKENISNNPRIRKRMISRSRGRSRTRKVDIPSRIKYTKSSIKRNEMRIQKNSISNEKAANKLKRLEEKLAEKKKIELAKANKDKTMKKIKTISLVKEGSDNDEPEFETPAFLLNSIEADSISNDITTTYETME